MLPEVCFSPIGINLNCRRPSALNVSGVDDTCTPAADDDDDDDDGEEGEEISLCRS